MVMFVVGVVFFFLLLCNDANGFSSSSLPRYHRGSSSSSLATTTETENTSSSPFDNIVKGVQNIFQQQSSPKETSSKTKTSPYYEQCETAISLLTDAANTKAQDEDSVVQALLDLEKGSRELSKIDSSLSKEMLKSLNGSWRLIFTTGTKETQKKLGGRRISYFPIKAIQSFKTNTDTEEEMRLTNGIYFGNTAVVKFFGPMDWIYDRRKLEFDFTRIELFGGLLGFDLKKGEAANLGAKTGLGSSNNVKLAENNKKAFFNWISANENIATARGGGGGLALWKRDLEMETKGDRFYKEIDAEWSYPYQ